MTTLIPKFDFRNGGSTPTGAVNRPINKKLAETISPEDFGAVGDGITNDTVALQNCINYAQTSNIAILLNSKYLVNDTASNGYCLLITNRITMTGSGWIFPSASLPATSDIIKIKSAFSAACDFLTLEGFLIGNTGVGRYSIYIDTDASSNFGYARLSNLSIFQSDSGYAIFHLNDAGGSTGGLYLSSISGCKIFGTISFTRSGSNNVIEHNQVSGSVNGVSMYYSQIAGGVNLFIRYNNFADGGGAVLIDSCNSPLISNNSIELDGSQSGSSGACININGGTATITNAIITQNTIGNLSNSAGLPVSLRIANAEGTVVQSNFWYTTNATQQASGAWILTTAAAENTWIDEQYFGFPRASVVLSDFGVETSLVSIAWRNYTPTVTANTGTVTTGTVLGGYERYGKTLRIRIEVPVTATSGAPDFLSITLPSGMSAAVVQTLSFSNNSIASGAAIASAAVIQATTAAATIPNLAVTYYVTGTIELA